MQCAHRPPHWHTGYIYCGCSRCPDDDGDKWSYRRRRERIHLGPQTTEIVVHLHRNRQAGLRDGLDVVLKVHRNRCPEKDKCGNIALEIPIAELRPYASDGSAYHFSIEGEFFTNAEKFPKGFYLGDVVIEGCVVDTIEIVKSPGVWVGEAIATTGACFDTKVFVDDYCPVEDCIEEEEKEEDEGRFPCEPKVFVAKRKVNDKYITPLDDLFEEQNG